MASSYSSDLLSISDSNCEVLGGVHKKVWLLSEIGVYTIMSPIEIQVFL
jgi:hypothetical protein